MEQKAVHCLGLLRCLPPLIFYHCRHNAFWESFGSLFLDAGVTIIQRLFLRPLPKQLEFVLMYCGLGYIGGYNCSRNLLHGMCNTFDLSQWSGCNVHNCNGGTNLMSHQVLIYSFIIWSYTFSYNEYWMEILFIVRYREKYNVQTFS